MRSIALLTMLELRTVFRTPSTWLAYTGLVILVGASPLFAQALIGEDGQSSVLQKPPDRDASAECPDPPPRVAARGEWPDWLPWTPDPESSTALEIRWEDDRWVLRMFGGSDETRKDVRTCLEAASREAREASLARYGIELPKRYVDVTWVDLDGAPLEAPAEALPEPPVSPFRFSLNLIAFALAGGLCVEQVPRRRSTGMLETLRTVPGSMRDAVWAFVLSSSLLAVVWTALMAGVWLAVARLDVLAGSVVDVLHVPFVATTVAALSVRTSLFADNAQAATIRWLGAVIVLTLGGLLGYGVFQLTGPALAALVPLGGVTLAAAGQLGPWAVLADLASLGWTALLVYDSGRRLDTEESSAAGTDPALLRQARGNWLPEASLLGALGLAAAVMTSASAFGDQLWLTVALSFLVFMVLPTVLAPRVLGLPFAELVPLERPSLRNLALAVPLTAGVMALGIVSTVLTQAVLPESDVNRRFAELMNGMMSDWRTALWIGVLPAIAEELLFRGAVMGLLLRSGRPWLANVGQAVWFALAHVVGIRLVWTFLFGLLAGWLRIRTGSLWVGMLVHLINNTAMTLLVVGGWMPSPWVAALFLPLLGLLALVLPREDQSA